MDLSFTFAGDASADYGITGSPKLPLFPAKRRNTIDIPGRDGSYDFGGNSYPPLLVTMDCVLKPASMAAKNAALSAAGLWLMGEGALVFGRDATKQWASAKVYNQPDLRHIGKNVRFPIVFECSPPWLEDVEDQPGVVDAATDYGSQLPFSPIITIEKTGDPATTLQVTLLSTGNYMLLSNAIVATDVVIFDMATGKVTLNGASVMDKLLIGSMPFAVPAGEQTITITTQSTYTASMSFRRKYVYA